MQRPGAHHADVIVGGKRSAIEVEAEVLVEDELITLNVNVVLQDDGGASRLL